MANWESTLEGMVMNPHFWRGKRVFLTGHTGFKGSWLSLWLQSLGAEVTGYALEPPSKSSMYVEAKVGIAMSSIIADIRDLSMLQKAMKVSQPDIVIHMAAQSLVRHSYHNPVETYSINVLGTVHVLESVRLTSGIKAVVVVTSDKCYENKEWKWGYRENEPMGGHDPYSSSKGCAELISATYRSSFLQFQGTALATARAGNVIGGGDYAFDRLVPDILRAFSEYKPVVIRNPKATRPWQHVLEPLSGYLTLAEHLYNHGQTFAEGWNFGPRDEDVKPVIWMVEKLAERWGNSAKWIQDTDNSPHEAYDLKLDISKARNRLNWSPSLGLSAALDLTVAWSLSREERVDVKQLTLNQISAYQDLRRCNNSEFV